MTCRFELVTTFITWAGREVYYAPKTIPHTCVNFVVAPPPNKAVRKSTTACLHAIV